MMVEQPQGRDPTWGCLEFQQGHLKCLVIDKNKTTDTNIFSTNYFSFLYSDKTPYSLEQLYSFTFTGIMTSM